jgi:hypothetical protein
MNAWEQTRILLLLTRNPGTARPAPSGITPKRAATSRHMLFRRKSREVSQ